MANVVLCHPNPTSPKQNTRLEKKKGDGKKKEKRKEPKRKQPGRQRQSLLLPFPPSQFTQDSLTSWFSSAHPPFPSDPSLSLKASSFFDCLVTSRIKEYVLALWGDSLIHPFRLFSFPGILLCLGCVCVATARKGFWPGFSVRVQILRKIFVFFSVIGSCCSQSQGRIWRPWISLATDSG